MSAFDTLSAMPACVTAGEGETWTESWPDYPDPTYSIAINFQSDTPVDGFQKFTISGTGSGSTWTFAFPTGVSKPKPGVYTTQRMATRTSDSAKRQIGCEDCVTIKPDLSDTPTTTTAQTLLSQLETALATLSASPDQSVSFNGQSYTSKDESKLFEERTRLKAEVLREKDRLNALSGKARNRNITVYFE